MKDANAYYRKHKTLDDCPGITEKTRNWLENGHAFASGSPLSVYGCPFPSYELQNSNATIKRVKERIAQLEAAKAAQPVEDEHDGYTYRENTEAMRVQFLFDGKGAWQRQLNGNGKYAAHRVMEVLDGQQ